LDDKTLELAGTHYTRTRIGERYGITFEQFLAQVCTVKANLTYNFRGDLYNEAKQIFQQEAGR